jgi:hypothetical protein
MNIERTVPAKCTLTAPQAQLAVRSTIGRGLRSMAGRLHRRPARRKPVDSAAAED